MKALYQYSLITSQRYPLMLTSIYKLITGKYRVRRRRGNSLIITLLKRSNTALPLPPGFLSYPLIIER
jgi:hypothetical protein